MKVFHLTPVAKARVWFCSAIPAFVPSGAVSKLVDANPTAAAEVGHVTLEAFVPRGSRAEYGLLGISFERCGADVLQIEVPYSEGEGPRWLDSLGKQVDDVRIGLSYEYAGSIIAAAMEFVANRFPPGTIKVVDAAHGHVGSSPEFFRRLTTGALTLMLDGRQRGDNDMIAFLKELLVG